MGIKGKVAQVLNDRDLELKSGIKVIQIIRYSDS